MRDIPALGFSDLNLAPRVLCGLQREEGGCARRSARRTGTRAGYGTYILTAKNTFFQQSTHFCVFLLLQFLPLNCCVHLASNTAVIYLKNLSLWSKEWCVESFNRLIEWMLVDDSYICVLCVNHFCSKGVVVPAQHIYVFDKTSRINGSESY